MPLNQTVLDRLRVVLTGFEGLITWMYMDQRHLVSTGVGFLMEFDARKGPGESPNVGEGRRRAVGGPSGPSGRRRGRVFIGAVGDGYSFIH